MIDATYPTISQECVERPALDLLVHTLLRNEAPIFPKVWITSTAHHLSLVIALCLRFMYFCSWFCSANLTHMRHACNFTLLCDLITIFFTPQLFKIRSIHVMILTREFCNRYCCVFSTIKWISSAR